MKIVKKKILLMYYLGEILGCLFNIYIFFIFHSLILTQGIFNPITGRFAFILDPIINFFNVLFQNRIIFIRFVGLFFPFFFISVIEITLYFILKFSFLIARFRAKTHNIEDYRSLFVFLSYIASDFKNLVFCVNIDKKQNHDFVIRNINNKDRKILFYTSYSFERSVARRIDLGIQEIIFSYFLIIGSYNFLSPLYYCIRRERYSIDLEKMLFKEPIDKRKKSSYYEEEKHIYHAFYIPSLFYNIEKITDSKDIKEIKTKIEKLHDNYYVFDDSLLSVFYKQYSLEKEKIGQIISLLNFINE